jgi:hypothetical protein
MALTDLQIERVREIIGYTSFDDTSALVNSLNAVQESETALDIAEWNAVRNKFTRIKGGRSGVEIDKSDNRLAIINRVRRRLGLSAVEDEALLESSAAGAVCYSHPAESESDCGWNRVPVEVVEAVK